MTIELDPKLLEKLEALPSKPGGWICPEVDKILLTFGGKKRMKDIAKVLKEEMGICVDPRKLQARYQSLRQREALYGLSDPKDL